MAQKWRDPEYSQGLTNAKFPTFRIILTHPEAGIITLALVSGRGAVRPPVMQIVNYSKSRRTTAEGGCATFVTLAAGAAA
jgi:hypothetical protein